jgi:hypothetical protein
VFFFISSTILSLSSAPQENRYWNANFTALISFFIYTFTAKSILSYQGYEQACTEMYMKRQQAEMLVGVLDVLINGQPTEKKRTTEENKEEKEVEEKVC